MSLKERLASHAETVERRLEEIFRDEEEYITAHSGGARLAEAMRYATLGGGKRIRAFLTMEFCLAFGGEAGRALDYACAMEMMHAFSLVHDDLPAMDNDDMRRGKPSAHKAFGEATAILAGDALAIDALRTAAFNEKCSALQNNEAVKCLACFAGGRGMCAGQQTDIDSEGKSIGEKALHDLVERKTGDLLAAACYMGAAAAADRPLGEKEAQIAIGYGHSLGLAFQIADDLLDLRSTSEKMGKTVGKDEKENKSTFAALLGAEGAERKARGCAEDAKRFLEALPESVYRAELCELCDFVLTRDH